jgi:hypothetical protein
VSDEPTASARARRTAFAHASEAELARILSYYDVRWEYEPDTFPIGWTLDGDVVESFAPDFYLPDLDLYVELTTLKQSLVRKKNRKLRRLRELYPDVRIKLLYARDFRMLLLKFGRLALADELSGTTGQATPPRGAGAPSMGTTRGGQVVPDSADRIAAAAATSATGATEAVLDGSAVAALAAERLAGVDAAPDAHHASPTGLGNDEVPPSIDTATGLSSPDAEGRTPRGRRRGRRRRAAAHDVGAVPGDAGATGSIASAVSSDRTLPG